MEHLYWHPSFDTGQEAMDDDHHGLADLIRALTEANSGEVEEVRVAARRLIDATAKHFAYEERRMNETNYPRAHSHKQAHVALLSRLADFSQRLEAGHKWHAGTLALIAEDFLFHHANQEDRNLAAHLLNVGATGRERRSLEALGSTGTKTVIDSR